MVKLLGALAVVLYVAALVGMIGTAPAWAVGALVMALFIHAGAIMAQGPKNASR